MIQAQSGGNSPKYGPKGLGGPIAKALYDKVKGKSLPSMVKRETVTGTLTGSRGPVTGPRPSDGKPAPEHTPRSTGGANPEKITGSMTPPKAGARPSVGKPAPDQAPRVPAKPNPETITGSRGGKAPKPAGDVSAPGARPVKPAPAPAAPTVYRAKKGDGLWQVAEKTKPAGVSTAAWWTKIKKLNSTNGKVNRTYTGTGVKLPKA